MGKGGVTEPFSSGWVVSLFGVTVITASRLLDTPPNERFNVKARARTVPDVTIDQDRRCTYVLLCPGPPGHRGKTTSS